MIANASYVLNRNSVISEKSLKELQTTRKGSFDLLRIILILMVCTLHACGRFDALFSEGAIPDAARYAGMACESLSIVAVNTWVIMSGYLLVEKEFKLSRFLELLATVLFYAVLGFLIVFLLAGTKTPFASPFADALSQVTNGGLFSYIQSMFPISAEYYWFMSCYLLLYILTPLINAGARALSPKQFRLMLFLFLIWTSLIKSIIPVNFVTDDGGYGIKWFICLYLIGAYFRLEEIGSTGAKKSRLRPFEIYIGSVLLIYVISLVLYKINLTDGSFAYFMTVPLHYNFVFTLTGACGLFLCFQNMELKNGLLQKAVTKLAPYTLGVYLLHGQPLLFYTWPVLTAAVLGTAPRENAGLFVLYIIETILILFVFGILADLLRSVIFSFFRKTVGKSR